MMKSLIFAVLLFSLNAAQAAHHIEIGSIRDVWSMNDEWRRDLGDYHIVRVKTVTTAVASGAKSFGRWKKCYSDRYENIPRNPFSSKYIYTSKKVRIEVDTGISEDRIVSLEGLAKTHEESFAQLDQKTSGKCKIEVNTTVFFEVEFKERMENLKYEILIEENDGELLLSNHVFNDRGGLTENQYPLIDGGFAGPVEIATYPTHRSF